MHLESYKQGGPFFFQRIKANPGLVDNAGFVDSEYSTGEIIPGDWGSLVTVITFNVNRSFNRCSASAKGTRKLFENTY